jgi:molybdopterin/thiamine biosynthesis adenylyltransferase
MQSMFVARSSATQYHESRYDEPRYLERTKRNHYWLGGIEGQMRLRDLRVGVAGLGGMGSNIAEILVRLGVGHIKISDPDIIERSNINRQVIATEKTLGEKKAIASARELRTIADDFELVVYDRGILEENAEEFVSDLDVIVDEIDVFPFRPHVFLHRAARKRNLPLYSGYIIGLGTHVYKFQGSAFTFEDFMLNNDGQIDAPSGEFLMNRLFSPLPSYLSLEADVRKFEKTLEDRSVPIFGATTFMSQALLTIRLITDVLKLDKSLQGPATPLMPEFLILDPFELRFERADIRQFAVQKFIGQEKAR